jgi:hypothetical protein
MRVRRELKPVPPDHPMFTRGVGLVFRSPLPPEPEQDESEDEQPEAES